MSNKPKYNIRAKSKTTGDKLYLMAFWEGEKGNGGKFDQTVDRIVLKDGKVIKPDQIYLDLFVNDEQDQRPDPKQERQEQSQEKYPDDEIPF